MSLPTLFLLFLSLVLSAAALATPHSPHHHHHHRALAARLPLPLPVHSPVLPIRRRQSSKRCRPRPSSPPQPINTFKASHPSEPAPNTPDPTLSRAPHTTVQRKPSLTTKPPVSAPTHYQPPPPPEPPSNLPDFMTGTQSGQGTFYGTGLGACGIVNKDTDFIAAASRLLFDQFPGYTGGNPNHNPICGRKVTASYQGHQVTVAIVDRCVACAEGDLDFSPSAFKQLADQSLGRIDIKWHWD